MAVLSAALAGCGDEKTPAERLAELPDSKACTLIPGEALDTILPGAEIDRSFPSRDSCTFTADAGDLIVTAIRPPRGPGNDAPPARQFYEVSLEDATANGAKDVRDVEGLPDGKIATNAEDGEIVVAWLSDGVAYSIQSSGWEGTTAAAEKQAEYLARQAQPLP